MDWLPQSSHPTRKYVTVMDVMGTTYVTNRMITLYLEKSKDNYTGKKQEEENGQRDKENSWEEKKKQGSIKQD